MIYVYIIIYYKCTICILYYTTTKYSNIKMLTHNNILTYYTYTYTYTYTYNDSYNYTYTYSVLYCAVLYYTILYYTMYYTILHYTILYYRKQ